VSTVNEGFCSWLLKQGVARWYIFKRKIPILGKFWRALEGKILKYYMSLGMFYGHLVYLMVCFSPFWYIVSRKIWQPSAPVPRLLHASIISFPFGGKK
jgi:hypothetical protein